MSEQPPPRSADGTPERQSPDPKQAARSAAWTAFVTFMGLLGTASGLKSFANGLVHEQWASWLLLAAGVAFLFYAFVLIYRLRILLKDMGPERRWQLLAMVLVGILVLVVLVGGVLSVVSIRNIGAAKAVGSGSVATSSASPTVSHSSSPRPSGQPSASLTYPADNTKVSREQGFTTGGIVKGLGADTIWILDHPADAYYVDAEAAIENGKWAALDRPLGSKSDRLPYSLTVVAVFATPECSTQLRHWESVGDVRLGQMPSGCYQFGELTVDVNRP